MDIEEKVLEFYSNEFIENHKHRLAMYFAKEVLNHYRSSSAGKVRMLYANGFYYAVNYYPYDYLTGGHTFYATVLNKDGFVLLDKTEVLDSHDQIFDGKDLILRTKDSILHYQLQNDLNFFPPQDIQLVCTFHTNEMHTYSNIKNIVFMNEKAYNYKTQSMIDFQWDYIVDKGYMDQIKSLPACIQKEIMRGIRNGIFLGVKEIKKNDEVEAIILAKVDQNTKTKGQFFYAIGENVDVCDKKVKDLSSCIEIVEEKLTLLNEEKKHTNKCIRKLFRP